jgi:uncharacterized protein involved in tolerance to divalent cations
MIMSRDEIKQSYSWPANVKQLIDRDQQIFLMKTARERQLAIIKRIKENLYVVD